MFTRYRPPHKELICKWCRCKYQIIDCLIKQPTSHTHLYGQSQSLYKVTWYCRPEVGIGWRHELTDSKIWESLIFMHGYVRFQQASTAVACLSESDLCVYEGRRDSMGWQCRMASLMEGGSWDADWGGGGMGSPSDSVLEWNGANLYITQT